MTTVRNAVADFFKLEASGGITLVGAAVCALVLSNSPFAWLYEAFTTLPVVIQVGALEINKPLLLWINDGLMAGVSFSGMSLDILTESVPLGIAAGLFFGKQIGVFFTCAILILLGVCRLPQGVDWLSLYGVSLLTGIGFTMSLFIGSLAFEHAGLEYGVGVRAGVLAGSILSALAGYAVLRLALRRRDISLPDGKPAAKGQ